MKRLVCMLLIGALVCLFFAQAFASSFWLAPYQEDEKVKNIKDRLRQTLEPRQPAATYEAGVLLALVDSREDAEKIAELYGITLDSVNAGLAKFTTDQDILELIKLGRKNGWPEVQPNYLYQLF